MAITFNTNNKSVILSEDIGRINLTEIYSRSVDWLVLNDNLKFLPPIRYSGFDPIPNGFTGATFFMINGWKLIVNVNTTAVEGVLFSEDYQTGYWTDISTPIHPVVISATVNTVYRETGISGLTEEESVKLFANATKQDVNNAIIALT